MAEHDEFCPRATASDPAGTEAHIALKVTFEDTDQAAKSLGDLQMLTFSIHRLLNINLSFLESLAGLHWMKAGQIYCTNFPTGINKNNL